MKDLMIFTFAAIICALASLLYFASGYINYRLLINVWLITLPLFILLYLILKYYKGSKLVNVEDLPQNTTLWDKYIVLESFNNYLQGLEIISAKLVEQGEELPILTEKNVHTLYLNVIDAQNKLKEQFTQETKKNFTEALFAYYKYINIRFNLDKIGQIQNIITDLPQVETEVKLLLAKSFSNILNINKEFLFIENLDMLATFTQSCYENYQVKRFYLVDGFNEWLEGLLKDMEKQFVDDKQ